MTEILWDAALDCVKILPFLFLSYLAVEYTEHRMSQKTKGGDGGLVRHGNHGRDHAGNGRFDGRHFPGIRD